MEGQCDKQALDKEGRVTELQKCGIPAVQALINCSAGSQPGLLSATVWLRNIICVSLYESK